MFYFDSTMILLIPAIILGFIAQSLVKSNYEKYKRVNNINGYSGAEVANIMLEREGIYDVSILESDVELSDNYNPIKKTLTLSKDVYHGTSISSACIAAHEVGHAIQHSKNYFPIKVRNIIVPVVNFSSNISWFLFLIGFVLGIPILLDAGIFLFSFAVFFQVVTLPVEFNASRRALKILSSRGILYQNELGKAKKVLSAAALTYVAAALMSILQLVRLIVLKNRND